MAEGLSGTVDGLFWQRYGCVEGKGRGEAGKSHVTKSKDPHILGWLLCGGERGDGLCRAGRTSKPWKVERPKSTQKSISRKHSIA